MSGKKKDDVLECPCLECQINLRGGPDSEKGECWVCEPYKKHIEAFNRHIKNVRRTIANHGGYDPFAKRIEASGRDAGYD